METSLSWITYPLFRLTICLATGIFLFDRFLPEGVSWPLWGGICCVLLCVGLLHLAVWRWRWFFGGVTGLAFFLWGGFSVVHQREKVGYAWDEAPQVYKGIVETVPEIRGKTWRAEVHVEGRHITKGTWQKVDRSVLLSWIPDTVAEPLSCGDTLCFYAKISRPFSEKELTGFDYGDYLLRKGISGTGLVYAGNWYRAGKPRWLTFSQRARVCQQKVVEVYRSWGLDEEVQAVIAALTIGDKSDLSTDLKNVYSAAGASHVLALSGLHVGILSGFLFLVFYPLTYWKRYGRMVRMLLVVTLLWGFAFISGLSSSVMRAVVMFSLYAFASCCSEERFSGIHSLVLAAFLMLLYNPFFLFDLSFQLSFAAVASILAFYPLCTRGVVIQNRLLRYLFNLLCLSVSAQVGTLPFVLLYFGTFPTYFLLANLIVSPLAACILVLTLMALALSSVPWLGSGVVVLLDWSTSFLNGAMRMVQHFSGSQITSVYLSAGQACLLAGIFICLYLCWSAGMQRKARQWICLLVVCNLFVALSVGMYLQEKPERLYFSRAEIYTRKGHCISTHTSDSGLIRIGTLCVGVLDDGRWKNCQASWRLPLDYVYICRGFKGNLSRLNDLFEMKQVILDSSLSEGYREMLIKECQLLKISYTDLSVQGSYSIEL
ncbi:ComEC/Rec2 family competence protein [uncultured Bacteroides sp.]|uniref:ComEC/Rec2 family competence protein n=1 Tax=uncultured Bacteroides sp. TaxID=162156 RepID=UPI00280AAC4C|nr:ComEC/Rec2 family competence protein [uncultured Bacteroides sp.]